MDCQLIPGACHEDLPARPRRSDVTDGYDRGVAAYEKLWSPAILPPAAALVGQLRLSGARLVVDVGAGTGALLRAIRLAAPAARTLALDASAGMLGVARARRGATTLLADALSLPLVTGCADAVILAYVLFHLADPAVALAEAARVLLPGGRVGAITWAWERPPRASSLWNDLLTEAGVPPAPLRVCGSGLDSPQALAATLRAAGLNPERIWPERVRREWDRVAFLRMATCGAAGQTRLSRVDAATRAALIVRMGAALDNLAADDLIFEGQVLCAIAVK